MKTLIQGIRQLKTILVEPSILLNMRSEMSARRRLLRLAVKDKELAATNTTRAELADIRASGRYPIEWIHRACTHFGDRPCLAVRNYSVPGAPFESITYSGLWLRVTGLANGLHESGHVRPGSFVALCGSNSVDWVVADLACLYLGAISVPIQYRAPERDVRHILEETGASCLIADYEELERLNSTLEDCPDLRVTIAIRSGTDAVRSSAQHAEVVWLDDLVIDGDAPCFQPEKDTLFSIVYTSGSTGKPKGVVYSMQYPLRILSSSLNGRGGPCIRVSYMPLNHITGRGNIYSTLVIGGLTRFIAQRHESNLIDDIRSAAPTDLMLVPRVSQLIYQHFKQELVKLGGSLGEAENMLGSTPGRTIIRDMRENFLGSRLSYISTGTAVTPAEVTHFLKQCFKVPVTDVWGSTELGLIAVDGRISRWTDFKLIDCPELGYTSNDKPFPRGELAIRSARRASGYFKNSAATGDLVDTAGYVRTGDIVELKRGRRVVWLARRSNVKKTAQGKFINLARLEEIYVTDSLIIEQIYLHSRSDMDYALAVVVPATAGTSKQDVRKEFNRIARKWDLAGFEIPRDFIVEQDPFSRENGLLSSLGKPRRPELEARYGPELNALYATIEGRKFKSSAAGSPNNRPGLIREAIARTLGLDVDELELEEANFQELGGDSLGAVGLSTMLQERGIDLPVSTILAPDSSIRCLISGTGRTHPADCSFHAVHDLSQNRIKAQELRASRFVEQDVLVAAKAMAVPQKAQVVLLTGASGFLGRFLALELLKALPQAGRLICLVRAVDASAARERLTGAFRNQQARQEFCRLAAGDRLQVISGDLALPRFGMTVSDYESLAGQVDCVVHAAALVNHVLAYEHLFVPNVLGTAEVLRFCLEQRKKTIHFVSSAAVPGMVNRKSPVSEAETAGDLARNRPAESNSYAAGYVTSKWAAELLMKDFCEQAGLPSTISRCSMVLAHQAYAGEFNESDSLSRLMFGIQRTGLVPDTFCSHPDNQHYDGLPVDIVARFIAVLATRVNTGNNTFHVSNTNWDDATGMDLFLQWAESVWPLKRLPYSRFISEFTAALNQLDEADRRLSPLPLVRYWKNPGSGRATRLDASKFRAMLQQHCGLTAIPSLDKNYFLGFLRSVGSTVHAGNVNYDSDEMTRVSIG